jgi:hypothetical protein
MAMTDREGWECSVAMRKRKQNVPDGANAPSGRKGVQVIPQREQAAGLSRLPRGMEDEVLFLPDQGQNPVELETGQRGQTIMILRVYRRGRIEKPHHLLRNTPISVNVGV